MWHDGMCREAVLEHYGYEDTKEPHVAMGFWTKDSVPERIKNLSDGILSAIDLKGLKMSTLNKRTRTAFREDRRAFKVFRGIPVHNDGFKTVFDNYTFNKK